MTDTTNVLVKWADRLSWAAMWAGHASNFNKSTDFCCMNDLAAEVRALREKLALQEPDATLGRLVREGRELMT